MNAGFVNVKVDREERPDVDSIYMEAVQAVTGSGGWPMTVFLLPDGRPFLGGTYFPRNRFVELLGQVTRAWRTSGRRPRGRRRAQLADAVRAGTGLPGMASADGSDGPGDSAGAAPGRRRRPGSPGTTPSGAVSAGPRSSRNRRCWSCCCWPAARTGRRDRDGPLTTLDAMAAGGIYDHLGGGFARYSTDRQWLVPHFEKMLYDNALLARVYLHAWQLTGADRYRQVVTETLEYLLRPPDAPDRWRPGLGRGRRQRGRPRAASTCGTTGGPRGRRPSRRGLVRRHTRRQLGRAQHPVPTARRRAGAAAGGRGGPTGPVRPPGDPRPPRPRRQGAHRVERHGRGGLAEAGAALGQAGLGGRRGQLADFLLGPSGAIRLRRAVAAQLAARPAPEATSRARPATSPTPPTTPGSSRPSPACSRRPAKPAGLRRRPRRPTRCWSCSPMRCPGRST
jgi:hypothetical protein